MIFDLIILHIYVTADETVSIVNCFFTVDLHVSKQNKYNIYNLNLGRIYKTSWRYRWQQCAFLYLKKESKRIIKVNSQQKHWWIFFSIALFCDNFNKFEPI